MLTLGIHDGHTATAALLKDGKIIAAISEERINGIKEWGGFPKKSIIECMKIAGVSPEEIDGVGVVGILPPTIPSKYDTPPFFKKLFGFGTHFLPESFLNSSNWVKFAQKIGISKNRNRAIEEGLKKLKIEAPTFYFDHHKLHAATGYYFSPFCREKTAVITCDGSGDAICASVYIAEGNLLKKVVQISTYNSLGEFYTQITRYLGMKPMSHEYKVMGLAPYSSEKYGDEVYEKFKNYFEVVDGDFPRFINKSGCWKYQYIAKFKRDLIFKRFDNIAYGAQKLIEEVLSEWISKVLKRLKIGRVVLSGGVFMNVKANYKILRLSEIEELFIFPSCGDESLPFGASALAALKLGWKDNFIPVIDLYFGGELEDSEIEKVCESAREEGFFVYEREDINGFVAKKLSEGDIVGRCVGRMEWGARALGNRSILADASKEGVIRRINEAIKKRDFWMPFAPSILEEDFNRYIEVIKGYEPYYMIMAFPTKDEAKKDLKAALHPYDDTARPQMVKKDFNSDYYDLILKFKKITGKGGILNTSFNLHGYPIVYRAVDAYHTFKNSGLNGLLLKNLYISKKEIL